MNICQEDFEAILASAESSADISKYFSGDWEFDSDKDSDAAIIKAAEQAIELVSTAEEATALFLSFGGVDGVITAEHDTRLFNKALEVVKTEEDLDTVFQGFCLEFIYNNRTELACRNHIRKIFDKADELGLETMTNIRK